MRASSSTTTTSTIDTTNALPITTSGADNVNVWM